MFHCSSKYHIMAKYHTIILCGKIPYHCIGISSNRLLVTVTDWLSYICVIPFLSRCAKDHASPWRSFINSIVFALLLWCQPIELKVSWFHVNRPDTLHFYFIKWKIKHRVTNSGEYLIVCGHIHIFIYTVDWCWISDIQTYINPFLAVWSTW